MEQRPELNMAFTEKLRVRLDVMELADRVYTLTNRKIGDLVVTSGKVIACEPFRETRNDPFDFTVTPGSYPVMLSILRSETDGHENVVFARVEFAPRQPVLWEMAVRASEWSWQHCDVENRAGCIMDAAAFPHLMHIWEVEDCEAVETALQINQQEGQLWHELLPHPRRTTNVFIFETLTNQDETYSYRGFDDTGECVCLITDYTVFPLIEISADL